MQVQLHAEHSWWGRDELVPDWSVCTLVLQRLNAGGHRGVSAGQHLPHGRLHADAATSWGMHHCLYNPAQTRKCQLHIVCMLLHCAWGMHHCL